MSGNVGNADLRNKMTHVSEAVWEIPSDFTEGMRVPARLYATEALLASMDPGVVQQIVNVATLPGILNAAMCMPDGHHGYGFPIGGVAGMDVEEGVISPGGIGFDINCGMRLVHTNLSLDDVQPRIDELVARLFDRVPAGLGRKGALRISKKEFARLMENGALWCVENGFGWDEDLERTEEGGRFPDADASRVSTKAIDRGLQQVGTLGSGNHYLEIQVAAPEHIADQGLAEQLGFHVPNQVVVMFHCGSRGFGHQIGTDYLQRFLKVQESKYGIRIRDRELACAPFRSPEGEDYYKAMQCAVNMAFANRQVILHRVREVFSKVFGKSPEDLGMHQVYDVAHNTAKLEKHQVDGRWRQVLVHRKGATRAFPPNSEDLPPVYKSTGQPVIIGGSMETGSYLLVGQESGAETFFTTAHGSGRAMSRKMARKTFHGKTLQAELKGRGITVTAASLPGLAEEAGGAYKDIDEVVRATAKAGISKPVVRLLPIGNIKG
ncbi:MAG: RtcB family protein [Planctomycetota bacterium]